MSDLEVVIKALREEGLKLAEFNDETVGTIGRTFIRLANRLQSELDKGKPAVPQEFKEWIVISPDSEVLGRYATIEEAYRNLEPQNRVVKVIQPEQPDREQEER